MVPFRAGTPPTLTSTPTTRMVRSGSNSQKLPQKFCFFMSEVCVAALLFAAAEPSVLRGALCGHADSVWGLVYSSAHHRLLSCSADGTVRLWDASSTSPSLAVFNESGGESLVGVAGYKNSTSRRRSAVICENLNKPKFRTLEADHRLKKVLLGGHFCQRCADMRVNLFPLTRHRN